MKAIYQGNEFGIFKKGKSYVVDIDLVNGMIIAYTSHTKQSITYSTPAKMLEAWKVEKAITPMTEIIEEVCGQICDHYCKYGDVIHKVDDDDAYNAMVETYCASCPLDKLQ